MARLGYWLALGLVLWGCQTAMVPTNQPLPQTPQGIPVYSGGYSLLPMLQQPQGQIMFAIAFSGGGKRSAAFGHGVLRGLKQIPVVEDGRTRSLLDEADSTSPPSRAGAFRRCTMGSTATRASRAFPTSS